MPIQPKTFPPRFSQNILYPATYDLGEIPIPSQNDYFSMGEYFNVKFGGHGVNDIPVLSYGKHKFDLLLIPQSNTGGNYSKLKNGTRILFEFKDSAGNLIFSDTTPIYSDGGFTGYVWVKQDPIRTYNKIEQGYGTMTIVAVGDTNDPNWRNKYNIRITHSIYLSLYESNSETSQITYSKNYSPIIFQRHTGSLGSGSGNLIVSEGLVWNDGAEVEQNALIISMSKLKTYSGEVKMVHIDYKLSGSAGDTSNPASEWTFLADWELLSQSYEDGIYKDYSQGINTLSERFGLPIFSSQIPHGGWDGSGNNKVKFKFRFKNPYQVFAEDHHTSAIDFELEYPKNNNEWLTFVGSNFVAPGDTVFVASNKVLLETSTGQFSFGTAVDGIYASPFGQKFDSLGRPQTLSDSRKNSKNN